MKKLHGKPNCVSFLFPHTYKGQKQATLSFPPFEVPHTDTLAEARLQCLEQLKTDTGPREGRERGTQLPSLIAAFKGSHSPAPQRSLCFAPFVVAGCFRDLEYRRSQAAITTPWI